MKVLAAILVVMLASPIFGHGVVVIDVSKGTYLSLNSTDVEVSIENQVAVVTATQQFTGLDSAVHGVYAFPMPAGASATTIRWLIGNQWHEAAISPNPQDTTLPSSGSNGQTSGAQQALSAYLGSTPLFVDLTDIIPARASVTVELTYVQLLPYDLGTVRFSYPNNYVLIQRAGLSSQVLHVILRSAREIVSMTLTSPETIAATNDGHTAMIDRVSTDSVASSMYSLQYTLSPTDLGLFGFSTYLDAVCDEGSRGFLLFAAEPNASDQVDAIDKNFILVIDRSGSMSGTKIDQAKNMATFVVQNLNDGDKFNIVDFGTDVTRFRPALVTFDAGTKAAAIDYISHLNATSNTNIQGALDEALGELPVFDSNAANIVIFTTDGLPNVGISSRDPLVAHVDAVNTTKQAAIFCFGVGSDVDKALLTRIASDNDGLASFVDNAQLQQVISDFYLRIRNPVLLNSTVTFSPPVVSDVYPSKLPNLYKGQQMLVTGRYSTAAHPLTITLGGLAYGKHVEYTYPLDLADTAVAEYQWLPKVWAKMKVEDLLVRYNSVLPSSALADSIKQQVIAVSMCFGVVTPFTSFTLGSSGSVGDTLFNSGGGGGGGAASTDVEFAQGQTQNDRVIAVPNPFTAGTVLHFDLSDGVAGGAEIRLYALDGRCIRTLHAAITGTGSYSVSWDGRDDAGVPVAVGSYLCIVSYRDTLLVGHLIKQ